MLSRIFRGEFVSGEFYGGVMTTKRRKRISGLVCPGCSEIGTLRKIIYGMPDPEHFDFEKYAVGGCCMNGDGSDPDLRCKSCEWEGLLSLFLNDQS
jgi:hypothetical protein